MENLEWSEFEVIETIKDNFIIKNLPDNFNNNHELKFHSHTIKNGKHDIKYIDLKYEIIEKKGMFFLKLFPENYDINKIHVHCVVNLGNGIDIDSYI